MLVLVNPGPDARLLGLLWQVGGKPKRSEVSMALVILAAASTFGIMVLWHAMKECGVRGRFRVIWTIVAGAFLVALLGGSGTPDRHQPHGK